MPPRSPLARLALPLSLIVILPGCSGAAAESEGSASTTASTTDASTSSASTSMTGSSSIETTSGETTSTSATTTTGETSATASTTEDTTGTTGGGDEEGGLSQRPADPIVLVGGQVPGLGDAKAGDVVGFARQDGAWKQIPVQVDERLLIDFCTIYAAALLGDSSPCKTPQTINALFYADPKTWTGADGDPRFDVDDELVFMARDAGDRVGPGADPTGVIAGSGVEIALSDGDERGWVYLFERDAQGGLSPDAGADLVSYDLVFAGDIDYKTEYPYIGKGSCGNAVCDPPILEDSTVTSATYERHFSARWVTDSLRITAPESTGDDLIDLAQSRFAPNNCGRHVLTFSTAEGAFVANIDGPLRAIRSYLGANSGPLTQRTHLFYDEVEVVQTFLRVHAISGIMELIDYSADAAGMTYYNEHNQGGFAIDGVPDAGFDQSQFTWELVSGPHGSVVSVLSPRLSQSLTTIGYYEDDAATKNDQCSASNLLDHPDDSAYGTSGAWISSPIPDTDPRNGSQEYVFLQRSSYYEAPDMTLDEAKGLAARASAPPLVEARRFTDALGPACGDGACDADEDATCPFDCAPYAGTCGDSLCDPWENSVNCGEDCGGEGMMGPGCGDDLCEPGEHELNCADDCWAPKYEPLVDCMESQCSMQKGACSDDIPCVDRVVCVAECVGMGGNQNTCVNQCTMQIPATPEQAAFAGALISCAAQNCS